MHKDGPRELDREPPREPPVPRKELGDLHGRLGQLTNQLARLNAQAGRMAGALVRRRPASEQIPAADASLSIDDAMAEIAARQRALGGGSDPAASSKRRSAPPAKTIECDHGSRPVPSTDLPPVGPAQAIIRQAEPEPISAGDPPSPPRARETTDRDGGSGPATLPASEPFFAPPASPSAKPISLDRLDRQLREITSRIEALRPAQAIETAVASLRNDLTDMGRQITEALPRRALESLELEIKALGERIDHSRQFGGDGTALRGLERGLAEVHDALRGLMPAESLAGFHDAVNALAQKVDLILARDDPNALHQLEAAIGGLRGLVSHIASNDALARVAEEVRGLAGQVDRIASSAASAQAVAALEHRIDTLTAALNASSEAGHAVPRDLEKLLAGLIERLEWVQLTHTDHAALAHLEDRIAALVKRFDASEARFAQLASIERGLADLLVHVEQMHGIGAASPLPPSDAGPRAPASDEVDQERRYTEGTPDIEPSVPAPSAPPNDLLAAEQTPPFVPPATTLAPPSAVEVTEFEEPEAPRQLPSVTPSAPPPPAPLPRAATLRPPIDPNLPPDHPLEPGSATLRSRTIPSAAERVAASEAANGSTKPPVISDGGRPNFIAAARRAAQAAAWDAAAQPGKSEGAAQQTSSLSERLRKLIVAGGAVLIVFGCARIGMRLFEDNNPAALPQAQSEQVQLPAAAASENVPPVTPPQLAAPKSPPPSPASAAPSRPAPAGKPAKPPRQSEATEGDPNWVAAADPSPDNAPLGTTALPAWASPDVTGTLPRSDASPKAAPAPVTPPVAEVEDKLPAAIGDPSLRAAALGGDPAAAYEVAVRFAEGRGVPQSSADAAHWFERAAKQGLAPAQFRLGVLYEKGTGVKRDLAKALDLYRGAAEKGNGKAMHNLAVMYAEGVGGTPDYANAAKWFRNAADHGIEDSQYNLGILYARGIGVQQNYAEAYKWFALAANRGDKGAAQKRDDVAARVDPQSLAAVRAAIEKWKPEPQPEDAIDVKAVTAWNSPATGPAPPASRAKPRNAAAGTTAPP